MIRKIISCAVMGCFLSQSVFAATQEYLGDGTYRDWDGNVVPVGTVATPNQTKVPDELNYKLLNTPRTCSPAELAAGKTSCNKCDNDVPNVVKPMNQASIAEMNKYGGFVITQSQLEEYSGKKMSRSGFIADYNGSYNFDTSRQNAQQNAQPQNNQANRLGTIFMNGKNDEPKYVVLNGYNLQGIHPNFKPFNNRTVCNLLRPQTPNPTNPNDGDKNQYGGAAVLGLAGITLGFGNINFGNIGANNVGRANPFNPKGGQGTSTMLGKMGNNMSFLATEMFACLEYYTGTNNSVCGGDHVKGNETKSHYCQQPLQLYYNTKMTEIYCEGAPCDGQADGAYRPTTVAMRKMVLMQNPFINIGSTMMESMRIAENRPMSCSGF